MPQEKKKFTTYKHTKEGMLVDEEGGEYPYISIHELNSYINERISALKVVNEVEKETIEKGNVSDNYKNICQSVIDRNLELIRELEKLGKKI